MPTNCAIHIYDSSFSTNTRASGMTQKHFFCGLWLHKRGHTQTQGRSKAWVSKTKTHLATTVFTSDRDAKEKGIAMIKGRSAWFALRCLLQASWWCLPRALLKVSFIWVSVKCVILFTYIQLIQSKLNSKLVLKGILKNTFYLYAERKTGLENCLPAAQKYYINCMQQNPPWLQAGTQLSTQIAEHR